PRDVAPDVTNSQALLTFELHRPVDQRSARLHPDDRRARSGQDPAKISLPATCVEHPPAADVTEQATDISVQQMSLGEITLVVVRLDVGARHRSPPPDRVLVRGHQSVTVSVISISRTSPGWN